MEIVFDANVINLEEKKLKMPQKSCSFASPCSSLRIIIFSCLKKDYIPAKGKSQQS
jgi:hypothetical protein